MKINKSIELIKSIHLRTIQLSIFLRILRSPDLPTMTRIGNYFALATILLSYGELATAQTTPSPTKKPTKSPTKKPTTKPTASPTVYLGKSQSITHRDNLN